MTKDILSDSPSIVNVDSEEGFVSACHRAAAEALEQGLWPVPIKPPEEGEPDSGKAPIGKRWGLERPTRERLDAIYAANPRAGLGLLLGPKGGVIDLDIDDPDIAGPPLQRLFPNGYPSTWQWNSRRGFHLLFRWDERLARLPSRVGPGTVQGEYGPEKKWNPAYPGIELRFGDPEKQMQTVIPPSPCGDGTPRAFVDAAQIAAPPESLIEDFERCLLGIAREELAEKSSSHPWTTLYFCSGASPKEAYGEKALAEEIDKVAGAPEGTRNATLNSAAFSLGQLVAADALSKSEVETGLRQAAERTGLGLAEIEKTIRSGLEAGIRQPRDLSHLESDNSTRAAQPASPSAIKSGLPTIVCGSESPEEGFKKWTPAAMEAMRMANKPPFLFQHAGRLARLRPPDGEVPPQLQDLGKESLRGILDRIAIWAIEVAGGRSSKKKLRYGPPPKDIVTDILSLGTWKHDDFPPLDGIVQTPRFLPDGKIMGPGGYYPSVRLYYSPSPGLEDIEISPHPTGGEVDGARNLLLGNLLFDFPFLNEASKANAVACMLLPFVRHLISGPTPNHHFTASTEGTGKGLCATACAYPSLGRPIPVATQKESEGEWRKALTTHFMSGDSHFFIDNMYNPIGWDDVPRDVDSGTLASVWTSTVYNDRILGGNQQYRGINHTIWMSSGNNVVFSRELNRRLVLIELKALMENPSQRSGFKYDPLMDWASLHRRELLIACLTLCSNWVARGRPHGRATMGSYEEYARVMGGILDACGIKGFLANRSRALASEAEAERWTALVVEWARTKGTAPTKSGELLAIIDANHDLKILFADALGEGNKDSRASRLGKRLVAQTDRVWGGWRITLSEAKDRSNTRLWKLQHSAEPIAEAVELVASGCNGLSTTDFEEGGPPPF